MRLLCFDPGETTGIAILDGGEWKMGLTVPEESLTEELFRSLVLLAHPHAVVIEALPKGMSHQPSLRSSTKIKQWFSIAGYKIAEINPGQWKGMTERVSISGTHQMDAATMGMWYFKSKLQEVWGERKGP